MVNIDSFYIFFVIVLAVYRLTRLIVFDNITEILRRPFLETVEETLEDGSIQLFVVPKGKGIRRWIGELISCYWCTGIWCSFIMLTLLHLFPDYFIFVVYGLGIAGGAGIIETIMDRLTD